MRVRRAHTYIYIPVDWGMKFLECTTNIIIMASTFFSYLGVKVIPV